MLKQLYIRNFILIDELALDFPEGFSAFTGETGAGKSILMEAIGLLAGDRSSSNEIRAGASKAIVEGTFTLSDQLRTAFNQLGFDDDEVTITREFTIDGKNTCRINHRIASLTNLKDTIGTAIDIHSQREHQFLLDPEYHLQLVDAFCADDHELLLTRQNYEQYQKARKEYERLSTSRYSPQQAEYLQYQIDEINRMDLKEGEDEELAQKIKVMSSYEKIYDRLSSAVSLLDGDNGSLSGIYDAYKELSGVSEVEELNQWSSDLEEKYYDLKDIAANLQNYLDQMEMDVGELDRMNERLYQINSLKRKYGSTITEILKKRDEAQEELAATSNREEVLAQKKKVMDEAYERYLTYAKELSNKRQSGAKILEQKVLDQLKDLALEKAAFHIQFNEIKASARGIDSVEFMIAMNPGEPLRPLRKAASGGELSRMMLGLKTVFTSLFGTQLIVFDEIDTGVSGAVAGKIGEKMREIGQSAQVFAVTHLAPVAAYADHQYKVEKYVKNNSTFTQIRLLNDEERIDELALINTGVRTDASRLAAKELLERAHS